jgi:hypothetical protein
MLLYSVTLNSATILGAPSFSSTSLRTYLETTKNVSDGRKRHASAMAFGSALKNDPEQIAARGRE